MGKANKKHLFVIEDSEELDSMATSSCPKAV